MRVRGLGALFLAAAFPLMASSLKDMPDWAQASAAAVGETQPPGDVEAWVLLNRMELAYHGGGEIRIRVRRVVRVLSAVAESQAGYWREGTGRNAGIRKLKGWNLRPDGELTKVDKGDLAGWDPDAGDEVTRNIGAGTTLRGVVNGSLVAYESEYSTGSLGPTCRMAPLERFPVRRFELLARSGETFLLGRRDVPMVVTTRHFAPWLPEPAPGAREVMLDNLPPLPRDEWAHGGERRWAPTIWIHFEDPSLTDLPQAGNWDRLATWYCERFLRETQSPWPLPPSSSDDRGALVELDRWMKREFRYQQVYLRADRAWIPEKAPEIVRKRYGDCKDLAAVFLGAASARGLKAFPALARISESAIATDEPPSSTAFNHVIAAIRLEKSMGFPAEVETLGGRFLIADPTARLTPLGYLPESHRQGRVMICTPEGAVWVDIPDPAIQPTSMRIKVVGELGSQGLSGSVTLHEEGDQEGLRQAAFFGTPDQLRSRVVGLMGLRAEARLELKRKGDPLDLDHPFALEYTLEVPRPLSRLGQEFELADLGFPGLPDPIQPKGRPRQLPVRFEGGDRWDLSLDLTLAGGGLRPTGPGGTLETPLRTVRWASRVDQGRLTIELTQETRRAQWDLAHREEGVAVQRKDRSALKVLLDDARTLLPAP